MSLLSSRLSERLDTIRQAANMAGISEITRGLEKESLRVSPKGTLSLSEHPKALGSALTHPRITTDYSEALLEFITPPSGNIEALINTLEDLHYFTYQHIGDESLWVNSMPCLLSSGADIPIARYGSSNSAKMKSVYRLGLGHRYGRPMQTIAGIHFNFSLSDTLWQFLREQDKSELSLTDYKTQGYFKLIRNFRRNFWLLLYLFGAAPAVCRSFVKGRENQLVGIGNDHNSLHTPYATSLRMGDLGYQSSAQESLVITYNCLESYTKTLCNAITQTHPQYQEIGIFDKEGHYQQLNDSLLQIENEFYSIIRPKRTSAPGQTALNALASGGVEYIEVRCLDLNPFHPVGIDVQQIHFLDCFLLYCLLEESPLSSAEESIQIQENQRRMVYRGRDPKLQLFLFGEEQNARDWGQHMLNQIAAIADLLDTQIGKHDYKTALLQQKTKLTDDNLTPSSRIIQTLHTEEISFYHWAMQQSLSNREHFTKGTLSAEKNTEYQIMANESLKQQALMEASDKMSFDEYIANYYAQYQCCNPKPQKQECL